MSNRNNAAAKRALRAAVFSALGDQTRLSLVSELCDGTPQSISQLTKGTSLTRQAVTKHLRVLKNVGIVRSVQTGRENFFALSPKPLDDAQDYLDRVSKQWGQALGRLKAFVEK
jgi:DNA-binding transcriptional ArsR family regulator